ncbi:MAG: hypothetical protein WC030_02835 [Candidatus Paceibacterota bacterium]
MDTDIQTPTTGGSPTDPAQKKYIRTFAGDMAVAQKGGTPDLVPLAPPVDAPVVPPPPPPAPEPVPLDEQAREEARARVRAKIAEDEQHDVHRPTERPAPLVKNDEGDTGEAPSPVRTYADDFSGRVKEQKASVATVLAAEQDATGPSGESVRESSVSTWLSIVGGVLLLGVSGVGIYYAYTIYVRDNTPVVLAPQITAPIFVNEQELVAGEGAVLLEAMQASLARPLASGAVRLLASPSATTTRKSLFVALSLAAPNILTRNIQGSESMVGIIHTEGEGSAFFLLSVVSYRDTFAGLLQWEPKMQRDLEPLFPPYPEPALVAALAATSTVPASKPVPATTSPTVPAYVPTFRDEVIANYDVRVLRDAQGRSLVLYGYWNQENLIIARNAAAFTEIVGRLANARTQP